VGRSRHELSRRLLGIVCRGLRAGSGQGLVECLRGERLADKTEGTLIEDPLDTLPPVVARHQQNGGFQRYRSQCEEGLLTVHPWHDQIEQHHRESIRFRVRCAHRFLSARDAGYPVASLGEQALGRPAEAVFVVDEQHVDASPPGEGTAFSQDRRDGWLRCWKRDDEVASDPQFCAKLDNSAVTLDYPVDHREAPTRPRSPCG